MVSGHAHPAEIGLAGGCAAFHYLAQSGVTAIPGVDDKAEYGRLTAAMGHIGLSGEEQEAIARLLAGLLHVGNATFSGDDEAAVEPSSAPSLELASSLMQVEGLSTSLISSSMTTRGETVQIKLTTQKAALEKDVALWSSTFVASEYIDMHMNPKNPDDTKTLFNGGACAAFAHCATPLSAMAAKNFAEMVNLGYLKTTDSLQEVARGMSAGVLLVTAKLTRHNKAGAYQTLTVQFKLVPVDAKLPLDKLLITEAWAKENHLLTEAPPKYKGSDF